jgi:hypothetical protein
MVQNKIKYIRADRRRKKAQKLLLLLVLIWGIYDLTFGAERQIITIVNPILVDEKEADVVDVKDEWEVIATERSEKSKESIAQLIYSEFTERPNTALAIAKCESSLDANRIGDTHLAKWSYGLFQINQTWHTYSEETLLNPVENIKIAKQIYNDFEQRTGDGFTAWTCYKENLYKKYL